MFNNGFSSSYINTARSAISFFSLDKLKLGDNPIISRLFKFVYIERPLKAKYQTYWSVSKLLEFLKSWFPLEGLGLRELTLKTLALIALSCSDRGQTIHLMRIDRMSREGDDLVFVIKDRTKSIRKVMKPLFVKCISTNDPTINVRVCVEEYISRTQSFRSSHVTNSSQLFLSWATHKPVCKATIARWLTKILELAGIDPKFKSHSFRGASLSEAKARGASVKAIMAAGRWKNVSTFNNYYLAPSEESSIGQIILNDR